MDEQTKHDISNQEAEKATNIPVKSKKQFSKSTIIITIAIIAVISISIAISLILLPSNKQEENSNNHTNYDAFVFYPQEDGTYIIGVAEGKYLSEITIPTTYQKGAVVGIAKEGFKDCTNLKSVTIPNGIKTIGESAFWGCSSLEEVSIPASISIIESSAFYRCDALKNVHINDLTAWMSIKFAGAQSNPLCYAENLYSNNNLVTTIEISADVKTLGDYVFFSYDHITSIVIPNNITHIGMEAFKACTNLESVIIGSGVKEIDSGAFENCTKLSIFEIGENVETIGKFALDYCPITTLVIPKSIKKFYGGDGAEVQNLYIDDMSIWFNLSNIRCQNLYVKNELVTEFTFPDGTNQISHIPGEANITKITIPASVKTIYAYDFAGCSQLTDIYYLGERTSMNLFGDNDVLSNVTWHFEE